MHSYIQYIPHIAMPLQYVTDMHWYQSISLVQDMVIVDVMIQQNNYIVYLTDIIIIIVNVCVSCYLWDSTYTIHMTIGHKLQMK